MGKANIYLILIVIIIPVFLVSFQNEKIENTTTIVCANNDLLVPNFSIEISCNLKENNKILSDDNFIGVNKTTRKMYFVHQK